MITGSIQEKKGNLYAVLNIPTASGGTKQKWVSMRLKKGAKKKEQQQRLDEIRLQYSGVAAIEAHEVMFGDYIQKWNEETKHAKSITTYDNYVYMINKYLSPYFNQKKILLSEIRPVDIEGYYNYLQKECNLSGNTALKHHQIIFTCLKYAVYNRLISSNPAEIVKRPKKLKKEHDFYTEEELRQLVKIAKGDGLETVIFLAVWFGLRREEILGLKWNNVDLENGTLKICETVVRGKQDNKIVSVNRASTKTETSNRVLPISEGMIKYLAGLKQKQAEMTRICGNSYYTSDYVCVDRMGNPLKPDYVTHHFALLLKKNNMRHIKFHDLRHSYASFMLTNGFSLKQIQEMLGHSSYSFTADTYTHVDLDTKRQMSDRIDDMTDN